MVIQGLEKCIHDAGEETLSHCLRVEKLTEIFCNHCNDEFIKQNKEAIIAGARYHDMGKSLIDKTVLYKKEKLTDIEFDEIKKHTTLCSDISKRVFGKNPSKQEKLIIKIALQHHQRDNERGYPPHKNLHMPLYIQIVSLADVIDAMTSNRCYKDKSGEGHRRTRSLQETINTIFTESEFRSDVKEILATSMKELLEEKWRLETVPQLKRVSLIASINNIQENENLNKQTVKEDNGIEDR